MIFLIFSLVIKIVFNFMIIFTMIITLLWLVLLWFF